MIKERDFAGKWRVVDAMDLVDDYLSLIPDPHFLIEVMSKNEVTGSYQFGAQDGCIDGRFEEDIENLRLIFSFEGSDEMDEVSGFGTAIFESLDTLILKMHYHMGDACSFRCKRNCSQTESQMLDTKSRGNVSP
jgi:hypothetical protein